MTININFFYYQKNYPADSPPTEIDVKGLTTVIFVIIIIGSIYFYFMVNIYTIYMVFIPTIIIGGVLVPFFIKEYKCFFFHLIYVYYDFCYLILIYPNRYDSVPCHWVD